MTKLEVSADHPIWHVTRSVDADAIERAAERAALNSGRIQMIEYANGADSLIIDGHGRRFLARRSAP